MSSLGLGPSHDFPNNFNQTLIITLSASCASQKVRGRHYFCQIVIMILNYKKKKTRGRKKLTFFIAIMQGKMITETTFQVAYAEYWRHQQEIAIMYSLLVPIGCPACSPSPSSVHIDGNMKLFVYDHGYDMYTQLKPYFDWLFGDDKEVLAHINMTDQADDKVRDV